jgi:hypothetical protein
METRLAVGTLTESHLTALPEPLIALSSGPKTDAKPRAAASHELLRLLATGQSELDENGELCVLQGRLYLASLAGLPVPTAKKYFVTLSKKMRYMPFCADFGPFNLGRVMLSTRVGSRARGGPCALPSHLWATAPRFPVRARGKSALPDACRVRATLACVRTGTLHHICQALEKTLLNPEFQDVRVVYYTSQEPRDLTNSIYLLGAFLCLRLGATPEEAWGPFQSLKDTPNGPMCLPYRDATWVKSSYDLHVKECWAGLVRAVATGLYDLQAFDKHEVRCFRCALHLAPRLPRGPMVFKV